MSPFQIRAKGDRTAEVMIYGDIGGWDEESVHAAKFVKDLHTIDADTINARINSYGGSVSDALAIYNAFNRHPAKVNTFVDGVAISAASLIAMAGDTVTMAENSILMIHAPSGIAMGNALTMREMADELDKFAQIMAPSYVKKTGKEPDEILALLTDGKDHWYTADEAKEAGFADAIGDTVAVTASFDFSRFGDIPAAAAAFTRSPSMDNTTTAATQSAAPQPSDVPVVPATAAPTAALSVVPPPTGRTLEQNREIRAAYEPFMARDGVRAVYDDVMVDPAIGIEAARKRLLDHLGKDAGPANPQAHTATPTAEADEVKATVARIAAYGNASRKQKIASVK